MTFKKNNLILWKEFLDSEFEYGQKRLKLYHAYQTDDLESKIALISRDLLDVEKRFFLYSIIEELPHEKQQLLAEELLPLAAMLEHKRLHNPAEMIIFSWGSEWLKANLYNIARKVIGRVANNDFRYIDLSNFYSGLIVIFRRFDPEIAKLLLEEILNHSDPDVRTLGLSWKEDAEW